MTNTSLFIRLFSGLVAALLVSAAILPLLPLPADQALLFSGALFPALSATFLISGFRRLQPKGILVLYGLISFFALALILWGGRL